MPIYEYQCEACGYHLEALQKLQESALTDCPQCGKATLRKLVSAPTFQLKGTGWYNTDYKKDKKVENKTENKEENKAPNVEKKEGASDKSGQEKKAATDTKDAIVKKSDGSAKEKAKNSSE